MPNLRQLTAEQAALREIVEAAENPEDFAGAIEDMRGDVRDKVISIWYVWKEYQADLAAQKEERDRLNKRIKATDNKAEWLLQYAKPAVDSMDDRMLDHPLFKMAVQDNPPHVDVLDAEAIPNRYKHGAITFTWEEVERLGMKDRAVMTVSKQSILEDYKKGDEAPDGVTISRGTSLRIK
tara:strand:- start:1410 stop:1949 length:540 start_codon:yes stop_codon:yes gene_type:complete